MKKDVLLPSLGDENDAVRGGKVTGWLAAEGDTLKEGDDLLEITTDKAAFVVPAPFGGTLSLRYVHEDDEVFVGEILCVMEVDA